jgi:hypothetical protein
MKSFFPSKTCPVINLSFPWYLCHLSFIPFFLVKFSGSFVDEILKIQGYFYYVTNVLTFDGISYWHPN